MAVAIPEHIKDLWDEWNLRVSVIVSLFLQIILILFATSRKRRAPGYLTILIWVAYLLADWIAAVAVGLISNGIGNGCPDDYSVHKNVAALWAPFLLLHLGGPDNITAFSLEDNELWIRHLFGLLIQFVAVLYILLQTLFNDFSIPTILVLIAGTIKYAERTRALYVACLGNFKESLLPKPDPGPNYAQLMEEYSSRNAADVPVDIVTVTETGIDSKAFEAKLDDDKTLNEKIFNECGPVTIAFEFYRTFRGLIVDHMLGFQERNDSRAFFFKRTAEEAFTVMEYELNFMYDELYTKMAVVHHSIWHLLRIICSALVVVSLLQFASDHKHNINTTDRAITYTLLIGAVVLDLIAHFQLIFSDWTTALVRKYKFGTWLTTLLRKYKVGTFISSLSKRLGYLRWSSTVSQNSLLHYCLDKRWKWIVKIVEFFGLKPLVYEWKYKSVVPLQEDVKKLIFEELKRKAQKARTVKEAKDIYSARGEYALLDYPSRYKLIARSVGEDVEFDESLLLWHIATELCYSRSINDLNPKRAMCKLVSEYMLYILIMRPTMMSAVAGIAQIRFQDTCEEAKKFFSRDKPKKRKLIVSIVKPIAQWLKNCFTRPHLASIPQKFKNCFTRPRMGSDRMWIEACTKLLEVNTVIEPSQVKGDRSKSVLFDACMLAAQLQELDNSERWEMMSRVWVELLCYGASHCRASSHAQLLAKGGELITFVWLLMAHFGLGDMFRIQAGHVRAKLIVGK